MRTQEALSTSGLTKKYGSSVVVDSLDLRVTAGTVHGLLGPNGSGKSTTMKMLLGLVRPTSGQISVLGEEMSRHSRAGVLSHVGSLIEQPSAYMHLTGAENMTIATRLLGVDEGNIKRAVELVRLDAQMDKLVKNYSLGMKQRLGLAMALLRDPRVLILDEPTNGLDPAGIEEIRDLIIKLADEDGRTILVSSHLLSEIEKMASELTIINHGKLLFQGSQTELSSAHLPDVFIETPDANQAAALLQALNPRLITDGLELSGLDTDQVANVCVHLVNHDIPIYQVVRRRHSLEEMFIDLTGREGLSA